MLLSVFKELAFRYIINATQSTLILKQEVFNLQTLV